MSRTVIQDSDQDDDEGEDELSNNMYNIQDNKFSESSIPQIIRKSGQSTDPAQFQTLYDINMAAIDAAPSDPPSSIPLPTMEELVRGSHCPPPAATKTSKLQRSKTINASSLTSISEPGTSKAKAKRAKSAFDARDLTQVTTPSDKENAIHDMWGPPLSTGVDMYSAVKSRRATLEKKTYGKQNVGRARTAESTKTGELQRPDSSLILPERNDSTSHFSEANRADLSFSTPELPRVHPASVTSKAASIQVPRSTSEETHEKASIEYAGTATSLPPATREIVTSSESVDHGPRTFQVVALAETLTPSQKRQYKRTDALPNNDSPMPTVDTAPFSDLTSSRFDELIEFALPSKSSIGVAQQEDNNSMDLPKVSTSNSSSISKRVRSVSASLEVAPRVNKLRRIKTSSEYRATLTDQQATDDAFMSEKIDLTPVQIPSTKSRKRKRNEKETNSAASTVDELAGVDDIGLPVERYVPRSSSRRMLNDVIDQTAEGVPRNLRLSGPTAKKPKKSAQPLDLDIMSSALNPVTSDDSLVLPDVLVSNMGDDPSQATTNGSLSELAPDNKKLGSPHSHENNMTQSPEATLDLVNSIIRNVTKIAKGNNNIDSTPILTSDPRTMRDIPSPATEKLSPVPEDIVPKLPAPKINRNRKGRARTKTMPVFHSESIIGNSDEEPIVAKKQPTRAKKSGSISQELKVDAKARDVLDVIDEDGEEETGVETPVAVTKKKLSKGKRNAATIQADEALASVEASDTIVAEAQSFLEEAVTPPVISKTDAREPSATGDPADTREQTPTTIPTTITRLNDTNESDTVAKKDKGPDKHSPLPNSTVRYRIGLSKKSKIAPLLKIRPVARNT